MKFNIHEFEDYFFGEEGVAIYAFLGWFLFWREHIQLIVLLDASDRALAFSSHVQALAGEAQFLQETVDKRSNKASGSYSTAKTFFLNLIIRALSGKNKVYRPINKMIILY